MSSKLYPEDHIDSRLAEMLEALSFTPQRNPHAVEAGKARYLAELGKLGLPEKFTLSMWLAGWQSYIKKPKEFFIMSISKLATTTAITLITVFVLLFGGAVVTAYAAQNALPGDTLYTVKTGLEEEKFNCVQCQGRVK